jgi:hypothetical protein
MFAKPHLAALVLLAATLTATAQTPRNPTPDRLEMKDGSVLRGMILRNDATSVLFQTLSGERLVSKEDIRRIHEEADRDIYLAQVTAPGRLPSWMAILHDFRDHDSIWRVQFIPAVRQTTGELRNIPYLSFNVNRQGVMNIYGPPEDPVAIQFGIFGKRGRSDKYPRIVREFLAGHLNSRREISTIYALSLRGDKKTADGLVFVVTPQTAPEAHGGWWITVADADRLERARVPAAKYASLTRPFEDVFHTDGTLREDNAQRFDQWLVGSLTRLPNQFPKIRGFYRDEQGVFRLMQLDTPWFSAGL